MIAFVTDLLTLGWRVVRALILPTLTRKGNLLSSLFVLFTSVIEQVINFGETVARVPGTFKLPARFENAWVFSRKYLRQGMLIAAWALFILSSLEWSGSHRAVPEQAAAQCSATVERTAGPKAYIGQSPIVDLDHAQGTEPVVFYTVHRPLSPPPCSTPRWLLLCTLRI